MVTCRRYSVNINCPTQRAPDRLRRGDSCALYQGSCYYGVVALPAPAAGNAHRWAAVQKQGM